MRSVAKYIIDSRMPSLGRAYRILRNEQLALVPPLSTPYGFKLTGHSSMAMGDFEKDELAIFLKYLPRASVCLDVGANIGLYTCMAASQRKQAIAVEPLSGNLRFLNENLVCNGFLDVEVFPLGLSGKGGIKCLFGGGTAASFVSGWAGASDKHYEVVPVTTLDTIASARFEGLHSFIKIDVEGFENEVLKGGEKTLRLLPKQTWLVEIVLNEHFPGGLNLSFRDTFEIFWRHGYQARIADRSERIVTTEDVTRWEKQGYTDFGSHNYIFL
jgi:FkbM family methyltransferase